MRGETSSRNWNKSSFPGYSSQNLFSSDKVLCSTHTITEIWELYKSFKLKNAMISCSLQVYVNVLPRLYYKWKKYTYQKRKCRVGHEVQQTLPTVSAYSISQSASQTSRSKHHHKWCEHARNCGTRARGGTKLTHLGHKAIPLTSQLLEVVRLQDINTNKIRLQIRLTQPRQPANLLCPHLYRDLATSQQPGLSHCMDGWSMLRANTTRLWKEESMCLRQWRLVVKYS